MKKENLMQNEFKGFSLFSDIEDVNLRTRNRAVVLANMAEDNKTPDKRITPKGVALMLGYFSLIPNEERNDCNAKFAQEMNDRGFAIVGG